MYRLSISVSIVTLVSILLYASLMKDATSFATPGSISARGATGHNRLPVSVDDLKKIKTLNGAKIRYKEPSICETTPGVRSFSGYIDLDEDKHVFFWFFESRKSPESDPVTLWCTCSRVSLSVHT